MEKQLTFLMRTLAPVVGQVAMALVRRKVTKTQITEWHRALVSASIALKEMKEQS